jgi:predicted amidohydrolase YtcJ
LLDAVAPNVPVYLVRVDGHAAWVNSKVLELAGITRSTPDPPGGRILRDPNGDPSGVVIDAAMDSVRVIMPPPSPAEREQAVSLAVRAWIEQGVTQVHDMGADSQMIRIYTDMAEARRLPFRVYAVFDGPGPGWEEAMKSGPVIDAYEGRLTFRALKLYADGALGSRGAALIQPYSDDPGNRGITVTSAADLRKATEAAVQSGFQVCTHAIGDRGNALTLDVYQDVLKSLSGNEKDVRLRVEHAQVLAKSDIPRFSALGVIPSMQPSHCTSDMYWAEMRLGPGRIGGAYAWRSLLDNGSIIPAGSDAPVEAPYPLWGFYAAITRQSHEGLPVGGWHPEQKMSREEALKSMTVWGAYAAFQEKSKGKIAPGYWADVVVLSKDIMTIPPSEILTTGVEWTIIGGEIVKRLVDD